MSLFRKSQGSLDELLAKLKNPAMLAFDLVDDTLAQVTSHPDATPKKLAFLLAADNPKLRDAGFNYLAATAARECAELMVDAIAAAPVQRRREMTQLLWKLERRHVVDALRRAFATTTPTRDLRAVVLEIIGYSSAVQEFLAPLKSALRPENPAPLRRLGVRQLRRVSSDPTVALMLRDLVHDDDEQVRVEALFALCDKPAPDMVETFFARLPHEKKDVQQAIVDALGKMARTAGVQMQEPLFTVLADENEHARAMAARLLVQLPETVAVLRRLLEYNRGIAQWLRERSLDALVAVADQLAQPLAQLMFDQNQDVRMAAMLLAARFNHLSIVPHVLAVWEKDKDWWSCSIAAEILSRFPTPQTFAALQRRATDPDLRFSVVHAMRAFKTAEATQVLLQSLTDADRSVRCTALQGLRERASEPVLRAVHGIAQDDPELQVRQVAEETLATLGQKGKDLAAALQSAVTNPVDVGPLELEMEKVPPAQPAS
jgi:HEAT repeat protein